MEVRECEWGSEQERLRAAMEIGVELLESGRPQLAVIVLRLALDPEASLPPMERAVAGRGPGMEAEIGALREALRGRDDPMR